MKKILVLIAFITCYTFGFSQSIIGKATYQKMDVDGVMNVYPYAEKTVSSSIEENMARLGYKGKKSKGYIIYDNVKLPELGPDIYKLYFLTDKKDKTSSTITLLISKGADIFLTQNSDPEVFENAKKYLDGFGSNVQEYDLGLQIQDQEDLVKKNDKKVKSLISDGEDLEKKKKKIEQQIEDNIKDQADQQAELQKQQAILDALKSRRKS